MKKINFVLVALGFGLIFSGCFPTLPEWDFTCQTDNECPYKGTICDRGLCIKGTRKETREEKVFPEKVKPDGGIEPFESQQEPPLEPSLDGGSEPFESETEAPVESQTELLLEPNLDGGTELFEGEVPPETSVEPVHEGRAPCGQIGQLRSCKDFNWPVGSPCHLGNQRCMEDGFWQKCQTPQPDPQETCGNKRDDNCDGKVDEGC